MTYKKILAAIDRSPLGELVFEKGMEIAKQQEANLMLFHCLPIETGRLNPYSNIYGQELSNFSGAIQAKLKQEIEEVDRWLKGLSQKTNKEGIKTESYWEVGDAGVCICDLASRWNADLIVIGRRGRQGLKEMFLGSVSNYVVHHASSSVLVIQEVEFLPKQK